jgi:hypothetical protein
MNASRRIPARARALLFLMAALALTGCGSKSSSPTAPGPTATGGNVNKAPVDGAAVNVHAIAAGGVAGALVAGPFTTNAAGDWTGSIPAGQSGPYLLLASGGSYVDEATAATVTIPAGRLLYGLMSGTSAQVTPFTHATYLGMLAQVNGGQTVAAAIAAATSSAVTAFGFDFATTVPRDLTTASASEKAYAALLGGLSTLIDNNGALAAFTSTEKIDLVIAITRDMSDGRLDGMDALGTVIDVPTDPQGTATAPLPALSAADLSALISAANAYAAAHPAIIGVALNPAVAWNPAAPPAGPCVVNFSGPGATLLPNTCFNVSTSRTELGVQLIWEDLPDSVQILLVPSDTVQNGIRTAYVSQMNPPYNIWNDFASEAIAGITRANNGTVTFTNVSIPALTATLGPITLNGTLPAP